MDVLFYNILRYLYVVSFYKLKYKAVRSINTSAIRNNISKT